MTISRKQSGFTLAELLIVVAIILVLVAIAIPVFTGTTQKAEEATCAANRTSLARMLTTQYQLTGKFDQAAAENLAKEQGFVCPNKSGAFTIISPTAQAAARVTCSIHTSGSISETMMEDFNAFKKLPENQNKSNDKLREAYFEKFEGKTYPLLKIGDKKLIVQPYYKSGAAEGENVWLIAKEDTENRWNVPCVYDPIDKKWYGATNYYGILDDANPKSATFGMEGGAEDLHAELTTGTKDGPNKTQVRKWLPLEHYEEIPSHDK